MVGLQIISSRTSFHQISVPFGPHPTVILEYHRQKLGLGSGSARQMYVQREVGTSYFFRSPLHLVTNLEIVLPLPAEPQL
jgi:hypothetical protein